MIAPRRNARAYAFGLSLGCALCGLLLLQPSANASDIADAAKRGNAASLRTLIGSADKAAVNAPGRDGMTALLWAAQANNVEMARQLLGAGADANLPNRYGITPLWVAATNRSAELASLLLAHGADASLKLTNGETALMAAARSGDAKTIELLIDAGGDPNAQEDKLGETALMWAAGENHADAVRALVAGGADPNLGSRSMSLLPMEWLQVGMVSTVLPVGGWAPLHVAAREDATDAALALIEVGADKEIQDPDGLTALNVAVMNAHYDTAVALLEAGVSPNTADRTGTTPLYGAVDMASLGGVIGRPAVPPSSKSTVFDFMRAALKHGAEVDAQLSAPALARHHGFPDRAMGAGTTPLMRAVRGRDLESVTLLLEAGASLDARQADGSTPLLIMAGAGRPFGGDREKLAAAELEMLDLLIAKGADLGAVGNDGQSAIHRAARAGNTNLVEALVQKGAPLDAKDNDGRTAFDLVSAPGRGNNAEMAAFLKTLGG
jgi:ankyrin repeat protein